MRRHAKRQVYAFLVLASLAAGQGALAALADGQGVPCAACQVLSVTSAQVPGLPMQLEGARMVLRVPADADGWHGAFDLLRARGARAGIHVVGIPADAGTLVGGDVDLLVVEPGDGDIDRVAFELKRILADVRGRRPSARLIVAATDDRIAAMRERGVTAYADDFIGVPASIAARDDLVRPADRPLRVVRPASDAEAPEIAAAVARLQRFLPEGLLPVPDRALTCGDRRRVDTFLNPRTLDLIGVTASCPRPVAVASDVPGATIERLDLETISVFLVHSGESDRFAAGVDVAAARTLTVEEIVARHQAAAARQVAEVETLISHGTMALTFEAPGFVAPITVTSEATIFHGPDSQESGREIRQGNIRVNGVAFDARGGVPKLPIVEPERAAAPPLAITLSDLYSYRLVSRESLRGRDAYVVAFEPRDQQASLFKGRAWIDAATFGMLRVSAAQTRLAGAITASEQTDDFTRDEAGRWLLTRSDVRQTYEGASVRTPIHRLVMIERHLVNPDDFAAQRAAALASNDVMLRDTPQGLRYLAKAGSAKRAAGSRKPAADSETPRELVKPPTRIRTVAFGTIVDPNISVPLPFAGLSYVDFDLFGTGTQFNGFFGGSYGQLAFSVPSLGRTRWQLAGRAFGIVSFYNDRAFESGREQYALDIRQRPAHASVWLLRPLSPRTALRIEYGWDYNNYERHDVTAPEFVVPRNQNAHTIRIGLDAQRAGWQGSIWGSYSRRIGWRAWGLPAERAAFSGAEADYQRYGASVLRSQAISARVTTRIEAAVMGGSELDRFSRYAFGTFDNRLHGYPSALIRYDRGGVVRTAAAVSLLRALRLDAFADSALVRDPGFGDGLRPYTGLGAAIEAPAPFGMLVAVEWGYGLQGIDSKGRRGTHVVRLSGYKVF